MKPLSEWSLLQCLIGIIIAAACCGVVYVALPVMGVAIPAWVIQIFWILVVAVIAIAAIKFLWSLWG